MSREKQAWHLCRRAQMKSHCILFQAGTRTCPHTATDAAGADMGHEPSCARDGRSHANHVELTSFQTFLNARSFRLRHILLQDCECSACTGAACAASADAWHACGQAHTHREDGSTRSDRRHLDHGNARIDLARLATAQRAGQRLSKQTVKLMEIDLRSKRTCARQRAATT